MSLSRRAFLTRSTLAVGGLLVGDAALEAFERLTHRKVFALGGLSPMSEADLMAIYRKVNRDVMEAMRAYTEEYQWMDDRPVSLYDITPPAHNIVRLQLVS